MPPGLAAESRIIRVTQPAASPTVQLDKLASGCSHSRIATLWSVANGCSQSAITVASTEKLGVCASWIAPLPPATRACIASVPSISMCPPSTSVTG